MDEKSSIQALDRTQPSLPMKKGRGATMTHDYTRDGTTTLFAALDVATGTVIGSCLPKHRHTEFLKSLTTIENSVPAGLEIHLILDNYATCTHANVRAWLAKHPRFHLQFTPTSSSWPNLVERWFHELADTALRRGVFHCVPDLIAATEDYLAADASHSKQPTKTAPSRRQTRGWDHRMSWKRPGRREKLASTRCLSFGLNWTVVRTIYPDKTGILDLTRR